MNRILSPAERNALKARAHPLRPVVMIGSDGLSAAVFQEIDANLKAHELIKIKVDSDDQDERDDMMGTICANTGASAIQHIGKILVVFRERADRGRHTRNDGAPGRARNRNGNVSGGNVADTPRGNKPGARAAGAGSGRKAGKGGQVWTKVRSQRSHRNKSKPRQGQ